MATRKLTRNQKTALLEWDEVTHLHTPPEYQGQAVIYSYGISTHWVYERVRDLSERPGRRETIVAYRHPKNYDGEFDPWNRVPRLGRRVGVIYRG